VRFERKGNTMEISELSYDFLRSMLLQERGQNNLSPIEDDFFDRLGGFVSTQEKILQDNFSIEQSRVVDNSRKLLGELRQTRLRKVLFKALKDFETNSINSTGLSAEEKEFYRSIISLLSDYSKKGDSTVRLKILTDLPRIQSPSGLLGPFTTGQTVSLDVQSAQLLLERKAAERALL